MDVSVSAQGTSILASANEHALLAEGIHYLIEQAEKYVKRTYGDKNAPMGEDFDDYVSRLKNLYFDLTTVDTLPTGIRNADTLLEFVQNISPHILLAERGRSTL